jgi:uncharacterized protein YeaC (DUF1315 family)
MRFAAQKNMSMQDNLPADGTVYMPNLDNKLGSMMKALRDWEKRRGLTMTYRGKLIENRPNKQAEEKPKAKAPADRPLKVPREKPAITVPRDRMRPGRKPTQTKEERQKKKNEANRLYQLKHNTEARQRSKDWRAKQSPEQRELQLQRVRDWKAKKKAEQLHSV